MIEQDLECFLGRAENLLAAADIQHGQHPAGPRSSPCDGLAQLLGQCASLVVGGDRGWEFALDTQGVCPREQAHGFVLGLPNDVRGEDQQVCGRERDCRICTQLPLR